MSARLGWLALGFMAAACARAPDPDADAPFLTGMSAWGLRSGGVALFASTSRHYVAQSRCEPGPCNKPGTFGDWEGFAGEPPAGIGSKPAIASWGDGRIDVFVRGRADGSLWHQTWESSRWLGWENLGGQLAAAPAAVSWGARRLDIFAPGLVRNSVWHLACVGLTAVPCRGGNFEAWAPSPGSLPVAISGDLAAGSTGEGRLEIFALGADGAIWHQNWDGKNWVGWESLGGKYATAPAVVPRGSLEVFTSDAQGRVWRLGFSGRGSSNWRKAGVSLDGNLAVASATDGITLFGMTHGGAAVVQASCPPYAGDCTLLE
jgi:hypothetical protein